MSKYHVSIKNGAKYLSLAIIANLPLYRSASELKNGWLSFLLQQQL